MSAGKQFCGGQGPEISIRHFVCLYVWKEAEVCNDSSGLVESIGHADMFLQETQFTPPIEIHGIHIRKHVSRIMCALLWNQIWANKTEHKLI